MVSKGVVLKFGHFQIDGDETEQRLESESKSIERYLVENSKCFLEVYLSCFPVRAQMVYSSQVLLLSKLRVSLTLLSPFDLLQLN